MRMQLKSVIAAGALVAGLAGAAVAEQPRVLALAELDAVTAGLDLGSSSGILAWAGAFAAGFAAENTGETETTTIVNGNPFVSFGFASGVAKATGSEPGGAYSISTAFGICARNCYTREFNYRFALGPYVAETEAGVGGL